METLHDSETVKQLENLNDIEQYEINLETEKGFGLYGRLYRRPETNPDSDKLGLVAIHGTTSHGGTFKKTIESLINIANYDWVITPDTPGHARSKTIDGKVEVGDYSAALGEFVDYLYQTGRVSGDRVLVGNSGHAAITIQMYNDDWDGVHSKRHEGGQGRIKGVLLSAPAYDSKDTFLGRFGPMVVELINLLPEKINIPQLVTKVYGKWFASNKEESKIQKERKVELNNASLYQDIKAMSDYARQHKTDEGYRPLIIDPSMNIAVIKSKKDNLSNGSEEILRQQHGDDVIIKVTGKDIGHHPHKQNPEAYSLIHKEILEGFGLNGNTGYQTK